LKTCTNTTTHFQGNRSISIVQYSVVTAQSITVLTGNRLG